MCAQSEQEIPKILNVDDGILPDNESDNASDNASDNESDNESDNKSDKVSDKELGITQEKLKVC